MPEWCFHESNKNLIFVFHFQVWLKSKNFEEALRPNKNSYSFSQPSIRRKNLHLFLIMTGLFCFFYWKGQFYCHYAILRLHYEVLRHWGPRIIDLTSQFLSRKVPESFEPNFPKRLSGRAMVWEWTLDGGMWQFDRNIFSHLLREYVSMTTRIWVHILF